MSFSKKISYFLVGVCTPFLLVKTQELTQQQQRFQSQLQSYISQERVRLSTTDFVEEKFLIEMMRHINQEIRSRNPNIVTSGNSDMSLLTSFLNEVDGVIQRIGSSGNSELIGLARSLRNQIQTSISEEDYNQSKHTFYDNSIEMLLIAERAIVLGKNNEVADATENFKNYFNIAIENPENIENVDPNSQISIFKVFQNLENVEQIKNAIRTGEIKKYQNKLISSGSSLDKARMAKDLFRRSLYRFNNAEYELAANLLQNLEDNYTYIANKNLLAYYLGLSYYYANNYSHAITILESILNTQQADQVIASALLKIYKSINAVEKIVNLNRSFANLRSNEGFNRDDFNFEMLVVLFGHGEYEEVVLLADAISAKYNLKSDAIYYKAMAVYPTKPNESKVILTQLVNSGGVNEELRNDCLLKLAYMSFDDKNYRDAIYWFDEISGSQYFKFENVLLGKAWCAYELESLKLDTAYKNYSQSKFYVNKLLKEYPNTDYKNEAKALMGYIQQKESNYIGAENEFRHVFESKTYKVMSDNILREKDSLQVVRSNIDKLIKIALKKNDKESFARLDNLAYDVDKKLYRMKYMDFSTVNPNMNSDIGVFQHQITEFERLREKAVEKDDSELIKRIDDNLLRLYVVVNKIRDRKDTSLFGTNYFTEQTLARKISLVNHKDDSYNEIANESDEQIKKIMAEKSKLADERRKLVVGRDDAKIAKIDILLNRLNRTSERLDFIKSYAQTKPAYKSSADLNKWSNYGAYQLTNIQYVQQEKIRDNNKNAGNILNKIDDIVTDRNLILNEKIKQIETTILIMNRKVARERRIADREKVKQFYETEFFDETQEDVNEDSLRLELIAEANRLRKNKVAVSTDTANKNIAPSVVPVSEPINQNQSSQRVDNEQQQSATKDDESEDDENNL